MSYYFVLLIIYLKVTKGLELIDPCDVTHQESFPCNIDQWTQFCILNDFECIVQNPSDFKNESACSDSEKLLIWRCYNATLKPLTYITDPDLNDPLEHLIFSVDFGSSYPRPYSLLDGQRGNVDGSKDIFHWNNTSKGNFSLKIYQPGYKGFEEILVRMKEDEEESNLVIILVTVIPCIVGLCVTTLSLWICYRRKICCFGQRESIVVTAQEGTNNVDTRAMQVSQPISRSNNGFIDDSTFAEVDLNDTSQNEAPMTSYIQRVAAR